MTPETAPLSHSLYLADFTHTIWVSMKDTFEKKMRHLNRILGKHGKPPITYTYSEPRAVPVTFEYHLKGDAYRNDEIVERMVEVVDVHCKGLTAVKKDDVEYTYLGTVSYEDGVKQVFCNNEAYANYFMDDFRDHFCDHCRTTRTNRKKYYLFRNTATNQVLQIGSTCAKEYFGIDSAAFKPTATPSSRSATAPRKSSAASRTTPSHTLSPPSFPPSPSSPAASSSGTRRTLPPIPPAAPSASSTSRFTNSPPSPPLTPCSPPGTPHVSTPSIPQTETATTPPSSPPPKSSHSGPPSTKRSAPPSPTTA